MSVCVAENDAPLAGERVEMHEGVSWAVEELRRFLTRLRLVVAGGPPPLVRDRVEPIGHLAHVARREIRNKDRTASLIIFGPERAHGVKLTQVASRHNE